MKLKGPILVIFAAIFIALILFGRSMFFKLNPGEKGVMFKQFGEGLIKEKVYKEGFHTKAPWNDIIVYNVREQINDEKMDVLDKNGLSVNIDVSVRFNPIHNKIGYLHEQFGKDYVTSLVIPEVRSAVRQIAGRYTAEEIYSTKRAEVEESIKKETSVKLNKNYILMNTLLIRSITLPAKIKNSIELKLKIEQEALAYKFKLEKEQSEAERKRIAAEGEAKANKIINSSLTPALLKMRGIEATLELTKSQNAKVVVVGSGKDGLPLILGNN